ncbi:helix-turn-helix domain-containing protein [Shewanella sp. 10N.286.54.B9]|uniref:helix-turn-helix domain-containing protein n=1 Tax=Shewanella sp. 10N.286.54.B9 TaxID=3229719 RepID=UPI00355282B8
MDIGKVSKIAKLPVSTIRYYEEKGLIRAIGRNGLRRDFADDVIQKLALIALGRNVGLSLDDIGAMFTEDGLVIDRGRLIEKADLLDEQISKMMAMRDGLRHAAACKASNHLACPKFLRYLKVAGYQSYRPKAKF